MTSPTEDVVQKNLEQLGAELEQVRAELSLERQKNARLQRELEEIRHAIADDPNPAEAQQRADAIASGGQAANYTPMTLHLLNGSGSPGGQKKASGRFWNPKGQQGQAQSPHPDGRRRRGRGGRHK
jgi:septal ring factor EnvC (AmiA/AmiB activator)